MILAGRTRAAVAAGIAAVALIAGGLSSTSVRRYLKDSPAARALNTPLLRRVDLLIHRLRYAGLPPSALGDGGPAARITLPGPAGVAVDRSGAVYLSDRGRDGAGRVVWRIGPDGTARIVAGNGRRGLAAPGPDARDAALGSPQGLAVDERGRIYVADSYNHVVVRIDPDGRLSWVAGSGRPGTTGDGGPATAARLDEPYDVALGPDGSLYIADFGNDRIRRVRADGTIETVAGSGAPGYTGDGGPAVRARLHGPYGVAFDPRLGLLIGDSWNHAVRLVDSTGRIRTIAGGRGRGYAGDGGPATEARLDAPQGVAVDRQGRVLIGDEHNHVVRRIAKDGRIETLAGTGHAAIGPARGPPRAVPLADPEGIAVRDDGALLVAEGEARRVRLVYPDSVIVTFAGTPSTPPPSHAAPADRARRPAAGTTARRDTAARPAADARQDGTPTRTPSSRAIAAAAAGRQPAGP